MNCFLSLEADFLILLWMAFSSGTVRSMTDWNESIKARVESEIQGFLGETGRVDMRCLYLLMSYLRNSDLFSGVLEFQIWEFYPI